jgi:hypothetical protein
MIDSKNVVENLHLSIKPPSQLMLLVKLVMWCGELERGSSIYKKNSTHRIM